MSENQTLDKNSILFMGLVTSFQQNALIGLGKMVDPISNETGVDLRIATSFIDMLDMLAVKTKGNLNENEAKILEEIRSHLKLNYLEEMKKAPKDEKPADESKTDGENGPEAEPESGE